MGKAGFVGTVFSQEMKRPCAALAIKNKDLGMTRSQVAVLGQLQAVCVLQASVRAGDKSFSRQVVLTVPGRAERFSMGSKHPTRPEWGCSPAGAAAPWSTRQDSGRRCTGAGLTPGLPMQPARRGLLGQPFLPVSPLSPAEYCARPHTARPQVAARPRPHLMLIGVCYSAEAASARKAMRTKHIRGNNPISFLLTIDDLLRKGNFYTFLAKVPHIDLYISTSCRHFFFVTFFV